MKSKGTEYEQANHGKSRPHRSIRAGADWSKVDGTAIRGVISVAANNGGAIRFGYTRDGGAFAIGIYGIGSPYTEYLRPGDDVEGFLREVCEAFIDSATEQLKDGSANGSG